MTEETTTETMSETSEQDGTGVERGNQCEMCDSYDDVKAVRDPEDNLLDMCADCRSGWPVRVVGDGVATDGGVRQQDYDWQLRVTLNGVDFTGPGCATKQEAEALETVVRDADGVESTEVERR